MAAGFLSRRRLVGGSTALFASRLSPALAGGFCRDEGLAPPPQPIDGPPLGQINQRIAWGVALGAPALYDPALIAALETERPSLLAIANGLKFGDLYASQAQCLRTDTAAPPPNWQECDDVVSLAGQLELPLRGDSLAWNDWLPDWLKTVAQRRDPNWQRVLQTCFVTHFKDVFAHFGRTTRPGGPSLRWCGLVNEPFNPWGPVDGVAGWRTGPWLDAFGFDPDGVPGYITKAFDLGARLRSSKDVVLFLNEANCDNDHFGPLVRPAMLKLVDSLQASGRAIDAVGLECHLAPQWMNDVMKPDWSAFKTFLGELSRRGVAIFLTELDVVDCALRKEDRRDALVSRYMLSFVQACLSVPAVTMVTNWDFSDRYSWLRDETVYSGLDKWASCVAAPPCPRPDLYDEALHPKGARQALAQALGAHPRK